MGGCVGRVHRGRDDRQQRQMEPSKGRPSSTSPIFRASRREPGPIRPIRPRGLLFIFAGREACFSFSQAVRLAFHFHDERLCATMMANQQWCQRYAGWTLFETRTKSSEPR